MKNGRLPWTRSCFVCGEANPHGLHLRARWENGRVRIEYTTRPSDAGYGGLVHGGLAVVLLDEAMTWAAVVGLKKFCVAAELSARLRRPIGVGQSVQVEAWARRTDSRLCLTEATIRDTEGRDLVIASGKYLPMPGNLLRLCEQDFVLDAGALHPREIVGEG